MLFFFIRHILSFLIPVTQWRRIYEVGCGKNGVPCVVYRVVAASFSTSGNAISSKTRNVM